MAQDNSQVIMDEETVVSEQDSIYFIETSPITKIKAGNFNRGLINDPHKLIQGRVPGLIISKPGGDPNGIFISRIRGIQSIGASSEPLVVVDGFAGASLESVDPADIESIEILKDIGASSIYGLRGGNGVILINTRKGNEGKPLTRYSGSVSFDFVRDNLSVMSAQEYRQLVSGPDYGSATDWIDEVTRTGISNVHNLSLSGKDNQTSYYVSMNYRNIKGISNNTGFEQLNGRFSLKQDFFNDLISLGFQLSSTNNNRNLGINDVFDYRIGINPTMPVMYDGTPGLENIGGYSERLVFDHFNPVSISNQAVNDKNGSINSGGLSGEIDLRDVLEGLEFSFNLYGQVDNYLAGMYFPSTLLYGDGFYRNGFASRSIRRNTSSSTDSRISYENKGTIINFEIEAGYFYQDFSEEQFMAEGGNFLTNAFTYNNLNAAQDFDNGRGNVSSFTSSNKLSAYYSTLDLNFKDLYFMKLSGRYEGSSRLGINNKWAFFPSLSLGIRLDQILNLKFFDYLQGRLSTGSSGRLPNSSYLSLRKYEDYYNKVYYDGDYIPSYAITGNENPDLATERTNEIDIGFDFGAGNGKIGGSLDWYQRNTKDMIMQVQTPVPPNLGYYSYTNIGQLRNNGLELDLYWQVSGNSTFSYRTSFMIATNETVVVSLSNETYTLGDDGVIRRGYAFGPGHGSFPGLVHTREGGQFGDLWGNIFIGIDQDGSPKFADLNHDGYACYYCYDEDIAIIGNAMPNWTLGWANSLTAGNFSFEIFFRGVFGHDLFNVFRALHENTEITNVNNWNVVNTKYYNPNLERANFSSLQVENASYFTLDNISLIYQLPESLILGLSGSKIFVTGQNLLTITGYTGVDPEVRLTDDSEWNYDQLSPGIERKSTYLPTRTFTLGIQIQF